MKLILPKKGTLIDTNYEDILDFYYHPLHKHMYIKRLNMCLSLMKNLKFNSILETGYGSGILFPTLNTVSNELHGIDMHKKNEEVQKRLNNIGIKTNLISGDILKLPYEDNKFDAIISISILEHIKDLDIVMKEFKRVLKPNGYLFIGSPIKNKLTDLFFRYTKFNYEEHHPSTHDHIINAVKDNFKIQKLIKFPKVPMNYSLYFSLSAKNES